MKIKMFWTLGRDLSRQPMEINSVDLHKNIFCPGVFGFPQISQKYAEVMNVFFRWTQGSLLVG
jgi:hypothetical protein